MSKTLYLLILYIINAQAWGLRITDMDFDNWVVLNLIYLLIGFFYFGKMSSFSWFSLKLKYWWWWVAGIFLSMLTANYFYNQSVLQSLITYREQLLLVTIPVLFKIKPDKSDIEKSLMLFSLFLWIIYFVRLMNPDLFNYDEETIEKLYNGQASVIAGWTIMMLLTPFYLERLKEKHDIKSLLIVFFCFLFAFLLENRSMLFSVTILIGWTMLTIKNKNNWIVVLTMAIIVAMVAYSTIDVWNALFEETSIQVEDEEYNRNKAIKYFLFEASPSIWCYIFGNGFLSTHATSLMQDMMAAGVYNSDVGFIGYWNQFGIIPIIVFLMMLIPAAIGKRCSYAVRCIALIILMCSFTSSYFGIYYMRLFFCMFYYLYYLDLEERTHGIVEKPIIET